MPLKEGSTKEIISENISELVNSGRTVAQASAIAYAHARKSHGIDQDDEAQRNSSPEGFNQVAFIAFSDKDRLLFLKRNDGSWGFAGGHVEVGENPMQGAIRESIEEIQHAPQSGVQLIHVDGKCSLYHCDDGEFIPVLNDEHSGYVWATMEDCPTPLFPVAEAMDKREYDTNGWFEVKNNPLSKIGVYPYSERSVGISDRTDKFVNVLRPEQELSNKQCLDSFKLLPWIDDHKMLGSEELGMTPAEQKGIQGVIGQDVYYKDGTLYGNIKIFSEAMSNAIEFGKKELSVGYRCRYEKSSGTFDGQSYDYVMRDIRGNHLALVGDGRMGAEVAVLDHSEINLKETIMSEKDDVKKVEDEVEMTLSEATAALEKIMPVVTKLQALIAGQSTTEPEGVTDGDEEKEDGETAKDEDEKDDKKDAMDMNEVIAQVRASLVAESSTKAKLHTQLAPHIGTFDHSEMSVAQMAEYGCKQLGIEAPKGDRVSFIQAFLMGKGSPSVAMDAAPTRKAGNFLDRHIQGAK